MHIRVCQTDLASIEATALLGPQKRDVDRTNDLHEATSES
jgi:hypothetical protein